MKKILITLLVTLLIAAGVWIGYRVIVARNNAQETKVPVETPKDQANGSPTETKPGETSGANSGESPAVTASPSETVNLFPAGKLVDGDKKFGYINREGEFVIPPAYAYASDFSGGAAVVSDDHMHYMAIDKVGKVLFDNEDLIRPFHNGAASFTSKEHDYLNGYINTLGKVIVEPKYRIVTDFNQDGKAYVADEDGIYYLIDKTGKVLEQYDVLKNKYGYISQVRDGYIIYTTQDNKSGVTAINGMTVIPPEYGLVEYLGENRFAVKKATEEGGYAFFMNEPSAIFNSEGKQLTDYIHYDVSQFKNGFASATDSSDTYFLNIDGKAPEDLPRFEGMGTLELLGDVIKADIDGELKYLDREGNLLWQYDSTFYLPSDVKVRSIKFRPNRNVLVYYPYVEGLKNKKVQDLINAELEERFLEPRIDITLEDDISVEDSFTAELIKDLLIINKNGYDYPFGAAHGMPIRDYYHIDIRDGRLYSLSDLFQKGSDYNLAINDIIRKEMEEQEKAGDSFFFPDSFKGINENQPFILKENSLVIYFTPYEIAAFATGFPEFEIPYEDLTEYINFEGDLWNSYH